jgi:myo-inositol catabolism protein IolS
LEYVRLGGTDLKLSVLGMGTWQIGSDSWGWEHDFNQQDVTEALSYGLDSGVNFIDTAELYGGGRSEEVVGDVIKGRRDDVVLASKVWPLHLTYKGVLKACNRSLRRLQVSTIDLYQIHFPNPLIPLRQTMKAMETLVKEEKIRYVGVSNFSISRTRKALKALESAQLVSNQVRYNLLQRGAERNLLPFLQESKMTLIAYSPLAQGLLSGRYTVSDAPKTGIRAINPLFSPTNMRRLQPLLHTLQEIGAKRGKSISQVALNWLMREPTIVPIPGIKRRSHVEEDLGAVGWRLDAEELAEITEVLGGFKRDLVLSVPRMALRTLLHV